MVKLGRLEISGISPTSVPDERHLLLRARSAAYSISYERRSKGE